MKRVVLILLLLAAPAFAAPDVKGAIGDIEALLKVNEQNADIINSLKIGAVELMAEGRSKDAALAAERKARADDKLMAAEQLKRATSWTTTLMALTIGGVGVVALIGGGFFGFALRQWDIGTGGIALGILLICLSAGISLYARAFAIGGLIASGAFMTTYVAWVVIRARKRELAGVDAKNTIPAGEKAGILTGTVLKQMKALDYQMSGAMGDRFASLATGKPVSVIKQEAESAAADVQAEAGATGVA